MVIIFAAYINSVYTLLRTSMLIILFLVHQWFIFSATYINGDYTLQLSSVVIILCSVQQW